MGCGSQGSPIQPLSCQSKQSSFSGLPCPHSRWAPFILQLFCLLFFPFFLTSWLHSSRRTGVTAKKPEAKARLSLIPSSKYRQRRRLESSPSLNAKEGSSGSLEMGVSILKLVLVLMQVVPSPNFSPGSLLPEEALTSTGPARIICATGAGNGVPSIFHPFSGMDSLSLCLASPYTPGTDLQLSFVWVLCPLLEPFLKR